MTAARYVLSDYLSAAMDGATFKALDDGSFAGRIAGCDGLVVFGETIEKCRDELRSTLEDWVLLGLKLGHPLPVFADIDLNDEPALEPVDSLKTARPRAQTTRAGVLRPLLGNTASVHDTRSRASRYPVLIGNRRR